MFFNDSGLAWSMSSALFRVFDETLLISFGRQINYNRARFKHFQRSPLEIAIYIIFVFVGASHNLHFQHDKFQADLQYKLRHWCRPGRMSSFLAGTVNFLNSLVVSSIARCCAEKKRTGIITFSYVIISKAAMPSLWEQSQTAFMGCQIIVLHNTC